MMVIAIGLNIAVPLIHNGVMPSTVVAVVSMIGRKRCRQELVTASRGGFPSSPISVLIR